MRGSLQRILAVAVVVAVVTATVPVGTLAAPQPPTDDPSPADAVYLTEDGDAILEYRTSVPDTTTTARTGLDVGEALLESLLVDDDGVSGQLAGGVDASLTPAELVAEGSLDGGGSAELRDLQFRSAARQNDDESRANLSVAATVEGDDAPAGRLSTNGTVEIGPDGYAYTGEVVAESGTELAAAADGNASVTVTESDDGYRLTVERVRTVPDEERDRWDTRAAALSTLSEEFDAVAADLDGDSEVTLNRYERVADGDDSLRVVVAYTVDYSGIEAALSDRLARSLAADRGLTLSSETADRVADRIARIDVDRIDVAVEADGDRAAVSWEVRMGEYENLPYAVLSIAESQDGMREAARSELATYRDRLDARSEAGLVRTVDWDGSLSVAAGATSVSLSVTSNTTAWSAYVDALSDRGIEPTTFSYAVAARTDGGSVVADASLTLRDEALVDRITTAGLDGLDEAGRVSSVAGAFRDVGFDRTRLDVTVDGGQLSASGGARFADVAAFAPLVEASLGTQVRSVASRAVTDERVRYVRVQGLTGPDPTREDVRALPIADADTTINLPGEWDREFPSMNVRSAESFLGVERTTAAPAVTTAEPEDGSGGLPGFGVGLGVVALTVALLLQRRR